MVLSSRGSILDFSKFNNTEKHFLRIASPIISDKLEDLLRIVEPYNAYIDAASIPPQYIKSISNKIISFISRAAIFELKLAKQAGELRGATDTERFDSFFDDLNTEAFWAQYPVLKRIIDTTLEDFNTYLLEIIKNYKNDWPLLFPKLKEPPKITSINADIMDVYPEGRGVAILSFENKSKKVYKPRNMAVDKAFQDFLHWFNTKQLFTPFKLINVIAKENYSWSDYVSQSPRFTTKTLEVAYQKAGCLMCFFHVFNTIDMHRKNIILVGDSPVCIDLETFLQAQNASNPSTDLNETHFLPEKLTSSEPDKDDLTYARKKGIRNGDNKYWTEDKELCWQDEGKDTMEIVRRRQLSTMPDRRLVVDGERVSPLAYLKLMVASFRKTYRFIEDNKTEFLKAVTLFKGVKIRAIERGVRKYIALIEEMSHPAILSNEKNLMQHLTALDYESDDTAFEKIIIKEEKKYLKDLYYPIFTTFSDSKHLYSNDKCIIENYFDIDAISAIEKNIDALSKKNMERQIRIMIKHFNYLSE